METPPDYITEIYCPGSSFLNFQQYSLRLQYLILNSNFKLNLSKKNSIEPYYWEAIISLNSLQKEHQCLNMYQGDKDFYDFLVQCFQANTVILSESSNNIMKLTFTISLNLVRKEISLNLNKKTLDITERVSHIANHVVNFDQRFEEFKSEIQAEIDRINQELRDYMKKTEEKLRKMRSLIEELQREKSKNAMLTVLITQIAWRDYYFEGNHKNFSLFNDQKTLKRTSSSGWYGWYCSMRNPHARASPKWSFSIKIDETDQNSYIMLGLCLKNSVPTNGYFTTNPSFCMHLFDGVFWNGGKSKEHVNKNVRAVKGEIYSFVFYTQEKKIQFFLNGKSLSAPKLIEFKNEDLTFLCPFVDINNKGTTVSIVDFDNFVEFQSN